MSDEEIVNAKIAGTYLGYEDHGIFTMYLNIEMNGHERVSIGGCTLDIWNGNERVGIDDGIDLIKSVMETVGVGSWEELKGQYIRVEQKGYKTNVSRIGNLMEDRWFSFKEFFEENKSFRDRI